MICQKYDLQIIKTFPPKQINSIFIGSFEKVQLNFV